MNTHGHDAGGHHEPTTFLLKYVFSTDHKVIGMQFMFASLLFVILGGLLALGVRYQIAWPSQDVPYASILPGKMTSQAPEANLGLWKIGHTVELKGEIQVSGQTITSKTGTLAGKLTGFPHGLGVTLPAGTVVRTPQGKTRTLTAPLDGFVDRSQVMGGYDYAKQDALAVVGTAVTIPGPLGEEPEDLTLVGKEVWFIDDTQASVVTDPLSLPIRTAKTTVSVQVTDFGDATGSMPQAGSGLQAVELSASQVTYNKQSLTPDSYLQLFTMHASIMIFFVIIPMLVGAFGNFLVPLMIGAKDMAFPKLNMLSFWLSMPAGVLMLASFWTPGGPAGGGWTSYPPLAESQFMAQIGTTLWIVGVGLVGFTSIVGALNYITTIINMRAPGMTMFRMPLTVWAVLITSVLALFATPMLTAAMIMLLLDRTLGTLFFMPSLGGQPLLFQHLFWFYSHPAVYIMILPGMGVVSDIIACHARKPIFGYKPMVYAMASISGLGFIVWGHHMFQSGMNPTLGTTFMASTILIAVPSAIKTFNWLGTLWGGNIKFTPAMLNALGFVSMFVIGGLSGIFVASAPVDIPLHDTYFIVAHIHYVLFGGSIFAIFAGVYQWYPKMFGRQLNQKWGVIHFIMNILAFNGTFFVMHILGIGGHPRRYASIMEIPTLQHLQPMNVFMTICAMMLGMAQLPFFYNFFVSLPRKLGRAIVAVFLVLLGLPTVIGLAYWGGFTGDGAALSRLAYQVWGRGPDGSFGGVQTWVGYLLLVILLLKIIGFCLTQLPRGGKIATVVCGVPVLGLVLYVINLSVTGKLTPQMSGWETTRQIMVSVGLGVIYLWAVIVAVYSLWAIGGILKITQYLQRLLYIVFLPAFLAPILLKQDPYMWMGIPGMFSYRWLLMMAVAVPGLLYLIMYRPQDGFGDVPSDNPWHANSLEWATGSPPPYTNFDEIPTVHRGPYEYSSPAVQEDYLPQPLVLPSGVTEPAAH